MADDEEEGAGIVLLRYGAAVFFLALYAVILVGGFYLVFTAAGLVDTHVLQPLVGGSQLLSYSVLGVAAIGYVMFVYRATTTGSLVGPGGSSAQSSLWDEIDQF